MNGSVLNERNATSRIETSDESVHDEEWCAERVSHRPRLNLSKSFKIFAQLGEFRSRTTVRNIQGETQ